MSDSQVSASGAAALRTYLAEADPRPARISTASFRQRIKAVHTAVLAPSQTRLVKQMLAKNPNNLKLHIGCGDTLLPGWINLDMARIGKHRDLKWNLCWGLPFPDNSVNAVFSEHVLEHFRLSEALRLLTEVHRSLRPQGVCRIGVPDLAFYVNEYKHSQTLTAGPSHPPTAAISLNNIFYLHGHKMIYDYDTLRLALETCGFLNVKRVAFGEGTLDPNPDSPGRRAGTLYVEAVK